MGDRVGERGGWYIESSVDVYIPPSVKQTAGGSPLCNTGAQLAAL